MFPKNIGEVLSVRVTREIEGIKGKNMTVMYVRSKNYRKRIQKHFKSRNMYSMTKDKPNGDHILVVKAEDFNQVKLSNKEWKAVLTIFSHVDF